LESKKRIQKGEVKMTTCEKRIGFWKWLGKGIKKNIPIFTLTDLKTTYSTLKETMFLIEIVVGFGMFIVGCSGGFLRILMTGQAFLGLPFGITALIGFFVLAHGFYLADGDC